MPPKIWVQPACCPSAKKLVLNQPNFTKYRLAGASASQCWPKCQYRVQYRPSLHCRQSHGTSLGGPGDICTLTVTHAGRSNTFPLFHLTKLIDLYARAIPFHAIDCVVLLCVGIEVIHQTVEVYTRGAVSWGLSVIFSFVFYQIP